MEIFLNAPDLEMGSRLGFRAYRRKASYMASACIVSGTFAP